MHENVTASLQDSLGIDASSLDLLNTDFDFGPMSDPTWLAMEDASLSDLHQSITSSSSASWVNSLSGSPEHSESLGGISASMNLSSAVILEQGDSMSLCRGPTTLNEHISVPETLGTGSVGWANMEGNHSGLESGEDPFMGWADKRAMQTTEEYGWVLSHVGQL
jgi:hypothetical protein